MSVLTQEKLNEMMGLMKDYPDRINAIFANPAQYLALLKDPRLELDVAPYSRISGINIIQYNEWKEIDDYIDNFKRLSGRAPKIILLTNKDNKER